MNNEPVAWLWNEDGCNLGVVLDQDKQIGKQEFQDYDIPLYTHPAKTLTDEEITEVLNDENIAEYHQGNWLVLPYAFARAILRKAQENEHSN